MKHLVASFVLCFCLITQSVANNPYNNNSDWRSLPFIEMMVTMMKIMNDIMDGKSNYYPGINTLPYSPAFMPGAGMYNGLSNFNSLPMSPGGLSNFPGNQFSTNQLPNSFPAGQNAANNTSGSFWDLDAPGQQSQTTIKNNSVNSGSLNGIWQALSGDVIAIYNNDHFIWSDGNARNLAGRLAFKGNQLYAYIPASKVTLQFQFYREPGQFIVRDKNSRVYTFKRLH